MGACNIGSAVAKPDNVLQLMSKAYQHAMQCVGEVDYALVARKMARTKLASSNMLPEICTYAKDRRGGAKPFYRSALMQFGRALNNP